jgi:beta-glucosidase
MNSKLIILVFITGLFFTSACKDEMKNTENGENLIDSLIQKMTIKEKAGQLTLFTSYWDVTGPVMNTDYMQFVRDGKCGNIFNAHSVVYNKSLQKVAVEETRLGIPLLFGYDVVHGHKTIFPVPLAEACSWDLDLLKKTSELAAREAAASGLNWTFAPMVDISRDPRWGRVSEGSGEDPYLGSLIAKARVEGFQGTDLSDSHTLAACIKHFAAYGAPVAGRDYNTVDMSKIALYQDYLPPYKAGIDAGAVTVMASFNELFGVPATASRYLITDILREEWGFTGFVVSDYTGIEELMDHGIAANTMHAGELSFTAGIDMDMQSGIFARDLPKLVNEGKISMEKIDQAVKRVLMIKYRLGLFNDPYCYLDEEREKAEIGTDEILEHALMAAQRSVVLLKNESFKGSKLVPIAESNRNISVFGPLAENKIDMLGSWHAAGDETKVATLLSGLKSRFPQANVNYSKGCDFYSSDKSGFSEALKLAEKSDINIIAIGETQAQSGEAASKSDISIPGIQEEFALELIKTGKPVIVIIMAERPLCFPVLNEKASAIFYAWHLGTQAGNAMADILAGNYNPSGKLVMSIPQNVGQIPIYYNHKNTGRPFDKNDKYTSKYLDVSNEPMYPFGYGLSYSNFEYSRIVLDKTSISASENLTVSVSVKNIGKYAGEETVQLYIRDMVGSITRPVKELKGFEKIHLEPGEIKKLSFSISEKDLRFYNSKLQYISEPGTFKVFIGTSSEEVEEAGFELLP